jgi:hypothetical protein
MHTVTLGGKEWLINEPVFRDLKIILAALNYLNTADLTDVQITVTLQKIITSLIGEDHVRQFRRYCWEAWKIPAPTSDELTALLNAVPELCGLTVSAQSTTRQSASATDWNALYWRIARVTSWTFSQIDTEMTFSRFAELSEHLNEKPLTDDLVAAYLGYEYTKPRTLEDDFRDWQASQGITEGH